MFANENKNVHTCPGIIIWDGISQPDKDDKTGALSHSLKIAIPANAAEKTELEQLAMQSLQASEFRGTMPAGGEWPIRAIDMAKFAEDAPLLQGRVSIKGKTTNGVPPIFDANGNELSAMQFGRMLYPGAVVTLLLHAYAFNQKSKGVAFGLDGVQIIDATVPKLAIAGSMSAAQVGAVFGGGGMPAVDGGGGMPAVDGGGGMPAGPAGPHTGFIENAGMMPVPAGPTMTPKAGAYTYDQYIEKGWTDAKLIADGLMLDDIPY
jgi:hypothetical protein